ncbi:PTS sugar transporter subunit IIA [Enterococcus sp. BWB1-3]|uniref:PTS sugar transporter subunit IIA n=1 Tax=unclassified Enterococcus TaxID=2608891 RepID=UPI001920947E|nr:MULTISPECIES: PTS sugar transporter subunit IIA [unclassified Enterococcus]MBL1228469.1 PTS sugar transporter subunit IIA [Enterococcus sp. BWB1-3]MCB5950474.1 PTS sugar transporter subunit IIA [Enterococcus sp. BWT-B8]MCB5954356.1 PTS sugar transporter subunit IIA [Enterococcus sp. CWB-B31]
MTIDHYFSEELADIIEESNNQEEFFSYIFQKLKHKGYVEDSFYEAVTEREKDYPTGLKTPFLSVAIPHTDPTHIKKPFVFITKLYQPISFGQMGSVDEKVEAHYVFVLGFEKGEEQLVLLQNLMAMFSDERTMTRLSENISEHEMYSIVNQYYINKE